LRQFDAAVADFDGMLKKDVRHGRGLLFEQIYPSCFGVTAIAALKG
jgi:hypothetical protein